LPDQSSKYGRTRVKDKGEARIVGQSFYTSSFLGKCCRQINTVNILWHVTKDRPSLLNQKWHVTKLIPQQPPTLVPPKPKTAHINRGCSGNVFRQHVPIKTARDHQRPPETTLCRQFQIRVSAVGYSKLFLAQRKFELSDWLAVRQINSIGEHYSSPTAPSTSNRDLEAQVTDGWSRINA
jgi:hypothetical protein